MSDYANDQPVVYNEALGIYERGTVVGETDFASGDPIKRFGNFEPRASLAYELNEVSSVKLGFSRVAQYIHLLSNTSSATPLDVWTPSGKYVAPLAHSPHTKTEEHKMAITAAAVKELRERTGAGMMDCKKALNETNGDVEAAVDLLRTKGLAAAQKKSSRTAAEGLVGIAVEGTKGVAVEVNSETDFVAKNEQFQDFVGNVTNVALNLGSDDVEALSAADYPAGGTVAETLTNNIATIGENQAVRRMKTVSVSSGSDASALPPEARCPER